MSFCPHCNAAIPNASMRFCGQCGAKLERDADAAHPPLRTKDDERREKEERDRQTANVIFAILWLVLPIAFGCVAAANDGSFWIGFFLGALANGVFRFLWKPFGF